MARSRDRSSPARSVLGNDDSEDRPPRGARPARRARLALHLDEADWDPDEWSSILYTPRVRNAPSRLR